MCKGCAITCADNMIHPSLLTRWPEVDRERHCPRSHSLLYSGRIGLGVLGPLTRPLLSAGAPNAVIARIPFLGAALPSAAPIGQPAFGPCPLSLPNCRGAQSAHRGPPSTGRPPTTRSGTMTRPTAGNGRWHRPHSPITRPSRPGHQTRPPQPMGMDGGYDPRPVGVIRPSPPSAPSWPRPPRASPA